MAYICKQYAPASAFALLTQIELQLVNMGWVLHDKFVPFTAGKNPSPIVGDELEGVTSGSKFNITDIVVTSGNFAAGTAAGFFGATNVTGQFSTGEILKNNTHILNPAATTIAYPNGNYYVIYRSNGETGANLTEYIALSFTGATLIRGWAYSWWNNATHVGNTGLAAGWTLTTYVPAAIYIITGDKDLVLVRIVANATGDSLFGHFPKRFHPTPLATLTAGCAAGNGIVMSVSNTIDFVLNQTYWVISSVGEGRWRCNVTNIGVNTLTVDNLGSALSAGAMIGALPSVFGGGVINGFYPTWDRAVASIGTGAAANVANLQRTLLNIITIFDPDESLGYAPLPYNTPGMYVLQPLLLINGTLYPVAVSDSIFLAPPLNVAENTFGITANGSPLVTGTATAGSNFTLTLLLAGWGINAYQNKIVIIASGTGLGQTRKIASNTADTLTVNTQWDANPNATSIFFIVDSAYRIPTYNLTIAYKEEI